MLWKEVLLMSYHYNMVLFTCWSCLHLPSKPMRKQLQANVALKDKLVSVNGWIMLLLGKLFAKLSRYILEVTLFATYSPKNNQSFPCPQCTQPFGDLKWGAVSIYNIYLCWQCLWQEQERGSDILSFWGISWECQMRTAQSEPTSQHQWQSCPVLY